MRVFKFLGLLFATLAFVSSLITARDLSAQQPQTDQNIKGEIEEQSAAANVEQYGGGYGGWCGPYGRWCRPPPWPPTEVESLATYYAGGYGGGGYGGGHRGPGGGRGRWPPTEEESLAAYYAAGYGGGGYGGGHGGYGGGGYGGGGHGGYGGGGYGGGGHGGYGGGGRGGGGGRRWPPAEVESKEEQAGTKNGQKTTTTSNPNGN